MNSSSMISQQKVGGADLLRSPHEALLPDRRTATTSVFRSDGSVSMVTLEDRYQAISEFVLEESVPNDVRVHFETARNLYLYAWFVYRFFPVAEQYALITLEFALCERLKPGFPQMFGPDRNRSPGLQVLIQKAKAEQLLSNEGLRSYERAALVRARERVSIDVSQQMEASGLSEMEYDLSDIKTIPEDYVHDALKVLEETLPYIRNTYAHGSSSLHGAVLGTFEIVADLVNQLFPLSAPQKLEET